MKTTLENVKVKESEIDIENGFAWIILEHDDQELILQLCLKCRKDKKCFRKAASKTDNGFRWGLCAVGNAKAVSIFGAEACEEFLHKELRKVGLKFEK